MAEAGLSRTDESPREWFDLLEVVRSDQQPPEIVCDRRKENQPNESTNSTSISHDVLKLERTRMNSFHRNETFSMGSCSLGRTRTIQDTKKSRRGSSTLRRKMH